jgi:hypothetical protein
MFQFFLTETVASSWNDACIPLYRTECREYFVGIRKVLINVAEYIWECSIHLLFKIILSFSLLGSVAYRGCF